jgi:hypothetical protein
MTIKTYENPKVGDTVWHVDEPETDRSGEVMFVDPATRTFGVKWYDGEAEAYDIDDAPDIIILES